MNGLWKPYSILQHIGQGQKRATCQAAFYMKKMRWSETQPLTTAIVHCNFGTTKWLRCHRTMQPRQQQQARKHTTTNIFTTRLYYIESISIFQRPSWPSYFSFSNKLERLKEQVTFSVLQQWDGSIKMWKYGLASRTKCGGVWNHNWSDILFRRFSFSSSSAVLKLQDSPWQGSSWLLCSSHSCKRFCSNRNSLLPTRRRRITKMAKVQDS